VRLPYLPGLDGLHAVIAVLLFCSSVALLRRAGGL
jgi:hypothetical protein